jgi:hypothetical protein
VVLSTDPGGQTAERPFHIALTEEAARHPVFQIATDQSARDAWTRLPFFTQYACVESAKPGAQVWMFRSLEQTPSGNRILMASQRYGAGLTAALCVQNFWRWRLAKDGAPQIFDRFWRQLFRWLGEIGREEVNIQFADQKLQPDQNVRLMLERQPNPQTFGESNGQFFVHVQDGKKRLVQEGRLQLQPAQQVDFEFRADKPDTYTIEVLDPAKSVVTSRSIEIHETDLELEQTARNMETLRQWATASGGLAFKAEECPKAADLVAQIKNRVEEVRRESQNRQPVGVNGLVLSLVLGCLCSEWCLRKRWQLP